MANARFVAGDAGRLPFADRSFDLVTAASSLEEAAAPAAAFAEALRVLRPGGVLRASYQD
ncbi:MAG: methyltransferase domain-containing protein [Chloroflexi bacterium]|nr:methyltransferase domain-containing protein [Chloroflexota bacterium]